MRIDVRLATWGDRPRALRCRVPTSALHPSLSVGGGASRPDPVQALPRANQRGGDDPTRRAGQGALTEIALAVGYRVRPLCGRRRRAPHRRRTGPRRRTPRHEPGHLQLALQSRAHPAGSLRHRPAICHEVFLAYSAPLGSGPPTPCPHFSASSPLYHMTGNMPRHFRPERGR